MGGQKSKSKRSVPQKAKVIPSKKVFSDADRREVKRDSLLIWLDANITESDENFLRLRTIRRNIRLFSDPIKCVAFLQSAKVDKASIITSGSLAKSLVPRVHSMAHVEAIYIFCGDRRRHEQWAREWPKIKGVHTEIGSICEALKATVRSVKEDSVGMSFTELDEDGTISPDPERFDPAFMYTQLFKNAFLDMEFDDKSKENLVRYCRGEYSKDPEQLQCIDEFARDYHPSKAIWWYTREIFLYEMLNRSFRQLEAKIIVNMGFFMRDLHRRIQQLHGQQVSAYGGRPFTLYRGQRISIAEYHKLEKIPGGLTSFNAFISTSRERSQALTFALEDPYGRGGVGVIFIMTIDPNITSTPFAKIGDESAFPDEAEILFSMHTVFRVEKIRSSKEIDGLYELPLTLTSDSDVELLRLTETLDEEAKGATGWNRVGSLLIRVGELAKAEELYQSLLGQSSKQADHGYYHHQLGDIKEKQGNHQEAIRLYQKALDINEKSLASDHPSLAISYNNIGGAHESLGEYSKALSYYEKALAIKRKILSPDHSSLATSYSNIGLLYDKLGDHAEAVSFLVQDVAICKKTLPPLHPDLATAYHNIGVVYDNMGNYSEALDSHQQGLAIRKKSLPSTHCDLGASYDNIGGVYDSMGEYQDALSAYKKALQIREKTLHKDHPSLAASYNNIGFVYQNMGKLADAQFYYKKAVDINEKTLPANHPSLATSYNNMGQLCEEMNDFSKAQDFYRKALRIREEILPANHPQLLSVRESIREEAAEPSEESGECF